MRSADFLNIQNDHIFHRWEFLLALWHGCKMTALGLGKNASNGLASTDSRL